MLCRLRLWSQSKTRLALESLTSEDQEQFDNEQQLKELMQALTRLRDKYAYEPTTAPSQEHLQYNEHQAKAAAVRAAALAPDCPPCSCTNALGSSLGRMNSMSAGGCGARRTSSLGLGDYSPKPLNRSGSIDAINSSLGHWTSPTHADSQLGSSPHAYQLGSSPNTHHPGSSPRAFGRLPSRHTYNSGSLGLLPTVTEPPVMPSKEDLVLGIDPIPASYVRGPYFMPHEPEITAAESEQGGPTVGNSSTAATHTAQASRSSSSSSSSSWGPGKLLGRFQTFMYSSSNSKSTVASTTLSTPFSSPSQPTPAAAANNTWFSSSTATATTTSRSAATATTATRTPSATASQWRVSNGVAPGQLPGSWGPKPTSQSSDRLSSLWNSQLSQWQAVREGEIGSKVIWFGELMYILRPLVYVCLLKR